MEALLSKLTKKSSKDSEKLRPPLEHPSLHVLTRPCWSCPEAAEQTSPAPRVRPSQGTGVGQREGDPF